MADYRASWTLARQLEFEAPAPAGPLDLRDTPDGRIPDDGPVTPGYANRTQGLSVAS